MYHRLPHLTVAAIAASTLLTGCISPKPSPRAAFYQLQPTIQPADVLPNMTDDALVVLLGPIEVAPYLARPQIPWREGEYQIVYDEFSRWAEPLRRNVAGVLEANLSNLLKTDIIALFPWQQITDADARLAISIDRLEGTPDGTAQLTIRWMLKNGDSGKVLAAEEQTFTTPVTGPTISDVIAAESKLLAEASETIAKILVQLLNTTEEK
jgi:uncharacterized lipoprotein YmbA